jgi:23S rRNA (uracil1939-C5)-methyltransferase
MQEEPSEGIEGGLGSTECPIAAECGGCARIGEPYAEQLAWKTERVRAALSRFKTLEGVEVDPCLPAPERWRYRTRAKLAVAEIDGRVRIGLYRRGSNRIVDLAPCVVQRPVLQRGLERVRHWLTAGGLASPRGPVFYVDLREVSGGRFHATFVVPERDVRAEKIPFEDFAAACPEVAGIALNFGNPASSYPTGPQSRVVSGGETFDAPLTEESGAVVSFAVPVSGFFQVATSLLAEVHRRMRAHLGDEGLLYDLYCGVGVHGLLIERPNNRVSKGIVGIEESPSACAAARLNAASFGIEARYVASQVEERLRAELGERPATRFVLNPGRSGCRPRVLQALGEVAQARIAYLSCNPDTLARDLDALSTGTGLRPRRVTPLDLMPQTDHVEALALLD